MPPCEARTPDRAGQQALYTFLLEALLRGAGGLECKARVALSDRAIPGLLEPIGSPSGYRGIGSALSDTVRHYLMRRLHAGWTGRPNTLLTRSHVVSVARANSQQLVASPKAGRASR